MIKKVRELAQILRSSSESTDSQALPAPASGDLAKRIKSIMNNYSLSDMSFLPEAMAAILLSHAPEEGMLRLERFLESCGTGLNLTHYSSEFPFIFGEVLATSGILSGRLNADITLLDMLAGLEHPFESRTDASYYREQIIGHDEFSEPAGRITAIHRMHIVQLMRLCARNADPDTDIIELTGELSALASAVIEECLLSALHETGRLMNRPVEHHSFFVLGLGKLGGQELNVSSDIDLIYLCDEPEGPAMYENLRMYITLAEKLTRLLTEPTPLGSMYRVDTRLRADGSSGPLVRTTSDYFRYLEMRGEAWERQMLLKARPVAGNIDAGGKFLQSIQRFIFPASITRSPNREVVAIKNQIEARLVKEGRKETHLKLMPGGIRDIEFITQCLQLLMGGIHPEVRCTGTFPSLTQLRSVNALNEEEFTVLTDAYRLYRSIENALQWKELLPAFTLPESLDDIAVYLGRPNLDTDIARSLEDVRAIYDDIFTLEKGESFEESVFRAAVNPAGDENVRRFMESLGFSEPEKSALALSELVFGHYVGKANQSIPPAIERFLPAFLQTVADLPDPGGALEHFKLIAEAYNARAVLFDLMNGNPKFFELLTGIAHGSVFITELLVNDPSLLDWLVEAGGIIHPVSRKQLDSELNEISSNAPDDRSFSRDCLRVKNREKLRTGTRDITGIAERGETFSELSKIAESIVEAAYNRARVSVRVTPGTNMSNYEFSVIAAGKLGSGMMDFGSDLDLIFVYRSDDDTNPAGIQEYSVLLAQKILTLLTGGGGPHKVYDVDARLRPEGGNSPLAVSIGEYHRYFEKRASVWERLALVRASTIAGMKSLGNDVNVLLQEFAYGPEFTRDQVDEILKIRKTMIAQSLKRYPDMVNVKSGEGGITDIDFIAQAYAASYGSACPSIRHRDTPGILDALGKEELIDRHDAATCIEQYFFLTAVEKAIRIGSGKSVNVLPKSGSELLRVMRLMDFDNVRRFQRRLNDVRTLTRELYERWMNRLKENTHER